MHSRLIKLAVLSALTVVGPGSAKALTFNFTTIPGDTLSAAQSMAFATAGNAWSSVLSDPVAVGGWLVAVAGGLIGAVRRYRSVPGVDRHQVASRWRCRAQA